MQSASFFDAFWSTLARGRSGVAPPAGSLLPLSPDGHYSYYDVKTTPGVGRMVASLGKLAPADWSIEDVARRVLEEERKRAGSAGREETSSVPRTLRTTCVNPLELLRQEKDNFAMMRIFSSDE